MARAPAGPASSASAKPQLLQCDPSELRAILQETRPVLSEEKFARIEAAVEGYIFASEALESERYSAAQLREALVGPKTEKTKKLLEKQPKPVLAGEPDQVPGLGKDRAALGCPGDRDAPAAAELQQALVPEQVQGAEHGVLVHAEHRGQVLGQREPLARSGLAVRDGPPDPGRDLLVQRERIGAVDVDIQHGTSHSRSIVNTGQQPR